MASLFRKVENPEHATIAWLDAMIERSRGGVVTSLTYMIPGVAAELLRRNEGNRCVRPIKVEHYARDMAEGRWQFNGEPVIVASSGELNDGQHRLSAVIDANTPVLMLVIFGVARESRLTVDQGAARTAGDFLSMDGVAYGTLSAGIARICLAYERSDGRFIKDPSLTNAEVIARVKADEEIAISAKFAEANARYLKARITPSAIGACYYIFREIDIRDANAFMTAVCVGENIKRGDPAFAVRVALENLVRTEVRQDRVELIMRGWNAFRQKRQLKQAKAIGNLPALV